MRTIHLRATELTSAADIQRAIDALPADGGRVVLPEMDLTLDRGIQLRSGVELVGQGRRTVLRQARARVYPLSGYHNYGMRDVPLQFTDGLAPGMTVTMRDRTHGGFFETFARLTWVEEGWVGLDRGLHSDYRQDEEPFLATSFPLIYGEQVHDVAVRSLTLDGQREVQPTGIGACRGAAVYFIQSSGFVVEDVHETGFVGEGLGFQMCSHVLIRGCRFAQNTGNGYHPGAGSTGVLFQDCESLANDLAGFYFCVRANHITVRGCTFAENRVAGLSVGTRDCHNLVEDCRMERNEGPGILLRPNVRPVEVHSCVFRRCAVSANARTAGRGQIDILGDAHDVVLEGNEIAGLAGQEKPGIYLAPSAQRITLRGNTIVGCFPEVVALSAQQADEPAPLTHGHLQAGEGAYRHLGLPEPERCPERGVG
jgi:hypothetical protein